MKKLHKGSSIAVRIFLTVCILIFVTLATQTVISTKMSTDAVTIPAEQVVLNKAEGIANTIQWKFSARLNLLVGFAEHPAIRNIHSSLDEKEAFLANLADPNFKKNIDEYGKVRVFDITGYSTNTAGEKEYGGNTQWFAFAKDGISSIIESVVETPKGKRILLVHACPIVDYAQQKAGAFVADYSTKDIRVALKTRLAF